MLLLLILNVQFSALDSIYKFLLNIHLFAQHQLKQMEAQKRQQELVLRRKTEEVRQMQSHRGRDAMDSNFVF